MHSLHRTARASALRFGVESDLVTSRANPDNRGASMSFDKASVPKARVIVVGNEKGGSGKSTVAMHISIALLKLGHRVATLDLDTRQKSFTTYVENRRTWA